MLKTNLFKVLPLILLIFMAISYCSPLPSNVFAAADSKIKPEEIPLYTYHTHPPFILQEDKGLSFDLAAYFTQKSAGQFRFVVKSMSRPRVNKMIEEKKRGIVPWVNPVWFKDKAETRLMWTRGALMEDGNAIISHQNLKLVYNGPNSLDGMTIGGLKGHLYQGIDDYIKNTGRLKRVDAENHMDNFRKLIKQHIHATLTPKSGAEYIIQKEGLQKELFISPKLHSTFKRRIININRNQEVQVFLEEVVKGMPSDPAWITIMDQYR